MCFPDQLHYLYNPEVVINMCELNVDQWISIVRNRVFNDFAVLRPDLHCRAVVCEVQTNVNNRLALECRPMSCCPIRIPRAAPQEPHPWNMHHALMNPHYHPAWPLWIRNFNHNKIFATVNIIDLKVYPRRSIQLVPCRTIVGEPVFGIVRKT